MCVEGKAFLHYIRWKSGNEGERQTAILKILAANNWSIEIPYMFSVSLEHEKMLNRFENNVKDVFLKK